MYHFYHVISNLLLFVCTIINRVVEFHCLAALFMFSYSITETQMFIILKRKLSQLLGNYNN